MDYSSLQTSSENAREQARRMYALARSLGFTGRESGRLANASEDTIRRIAAERDALQVKTK